MRSLHHQRALPERDPMLLISGLSRVYVEDGVRLDVSIFRLEHESAWSLDVYVEGGDCIAWDETFPTEHAALAAFLRVVTEEGAGVFVARMHS